jgi:phthalate 4,5-dioxygenase oxygenase subunit
VLSIADNELLTRTDKGTLAGDYFRRFWMPALLSEEIPIADCPPVRVKLMGEQLIAFRDSEGRVGLVDRYCAHRQMDLFYGRNEGCGIRCVYHGWKFDIEGKCVDMPAEPPESAYKDRIQLKSYPCIERAGMIWAYMGPKDFPAQFPEFEFNDLPKGHWYLRKSLLECNYLQAMEGNLDSSHVAYLHGFLSGTSLDPTGAGHGRRGGLDASKYRQARPTFEVHDTPYGCMVGAKRPEGNGNAYWRVTQWLLPVHTIIASPPGETILWDAWVPMDDEHTWVYRIEYNPWRPLTEQELYSYDHVGFTRLNVENIPGTYFPKRNKGNDYLLDRELQKTYSFTGIRGTNAQDAAGVENQGAAPIADRSQEKLGASDLAIIRVRRTMLSALKNFKEGKEPEAAKNGDWYAVRAVAVSLPDDGTPFYEGAKELLSSASTQPAT